MCFSFPKEWKKTSQTTKSHKEKRYICTPTNPVKERRSCSAHITFNVHKVLAQTDTQTAARRPTHQNDPHFKEKTPSNIPVSSFSACPLLDLFKTRGLICSKHTTFFTCRQDSCKASSVLRSLEYFRVVNECLSRIGAVNAQRRLFTKITLFQCSY